MTAAASTQEIVERRVHLNFKMGRVGEVLDHAAYYLCGRIPDRLTNQVFDHSRKAREHYGRFTLFPDHIDPTPDMSDPAIFWREAEAMERQANGQVSRRILFTIPRGLEREKHREYLTHCLAPLVGAGMAIHIDLHDPGARDGGEQPHAHIMTTMRRLNPDGTFSKTKAREWNAMFRAGDGKIMRAQFEDRGNRWLAENGYNIRLRIRSNEELDGPDALPPEPQVSRAEIETTKRTPDAPSPAIISLEKHRELHRRAVKSKRAVDGLSAEIVRLETHIREDRQRLHQQHGADRMATRQRNGWPGGTDGYAALPDALKASARKSYDDWKARQVADGKAEADIFNLTDYVDFVQARRREDMGWRFEKPGDNANAVRSDSEPPAPPADDMPDDDGWDRATRFRARLLAGHYKISEASLTPAQVAAISNIRLDRKRGVATIELASGDTFEDFGDRIVSARDPSPETAAHLAQAAQRHGWSNVNLTGTPAYRDEVAIALALLEPPVGHDWELSDDAKKRLDEALAARKAAVENTNAIRPVEMVQANEITPVVAPVAEPVEPAPEPVAEAEPVAEVIQPAPVEPAPAARTVFVTNPRDAEQDTDIAAMRTRLASDAPKMAAMPDEALENRLKSSFPHYNQTGDTEADAAARISAVAAWRAAQQAKKEAKNANDETTAQRNDTLNPGADGAVHRPAGVHASGQGGAHAGAGMGDVRPQRSAGAVPADAWAGGADVRGPAAAGRTGKHVIMRRLAEIQREYRAATASVPSVDDMIKPQVAALDEEIRTRREKGQRLADDAFGADTATYGARYRPIKRWLAQNEARKLGAKGAEEQVTAEKLEAGRPEIIAEARRMASEERGKLLVEAMNKVPGLKDAVEAGIAITGALQARDEATTLALETGDFAAVTAAAQEWRQKQHQADELARKIEVIDQNIESARNDAVVAKEKFNDASSHAGLLRSPLDGALAPFKRHRLIKAEKAAVKAVVAAKETANEMVKNRDKAVTDVKAEVPAQMTREQKEAAFRAEILRAERQREEDRKRREATEAQQGQDRPAHAPD
ncbi:MobA/MobL family protein [Nguyenibacter sp. L1]|uniref:MobA/MobL family protein n=1 Tax=Nguyenibacter sp. L1 TaxID=3049350 RepID=UPI002B46C93D|nr:MobA/MobL family protein [Nguyenibacter sp. L1]WRH89574.1 MobA/MobL family protein [Nguyenibacter sp. L1]